MKIEGLIPRFHVAVVTYTTWPQEGRNLGGNSVWGVIVMCKEKRRQEPRKEKEKRKK